MGLDLLDLSGQEIALPARPDGEGNTVATEEECPFFDWDLFTHDTNSPTNLLEPQWDSLESNDTLDPNTIFSPPNQDTRFTTQDLNSEFIPPANLTTTVNLRQPGHGFSDVSQWLDGAYSPPHPCSYCRRHRLQCLILRTTSANPNPITSCSSCAALFRECSLALGEKRQASRFETQVPVLGHLHGVTEEGDDGLASQPASLNLPINPDPPTGQTEPTPADTKHFIRKGARVLRAWFFQNQEHPYPTDEQKAHLARETGFSAKRVSTWFANARRRQRLKVQSAITPRVTRAGSPMPQPVVGRWTSMTPLERWQASPPDDEAVPESAIRDALAASSGPPGSAASSASAQTDESFADAFLNFDETSSCFDSSLSGSGLGSRHSETSSSVSSAWSHGSSPAHIDPSPWSSTSHRRRHQRGRSRPSSPSSSTSKPTHQFECTFCPKSFKKKSDWTRHETTIHLPTITTWICTPDLNQLLLFPSLNPGTNSDANLSSPFHSNKNNNNKNNPQECPFCPLPNPPPTHHATHEFQTCSARPPHERTFTRRDHLAQHLRKYHACTKLPLQLDEWRRTRATIRSACGFCGERMESWAERANHIAGHFREGCRMGEWTGGCGVGLEEGVEGGLRGVTRVYGGS